MENSKELIRDIYEKVSNQSDLEWIDIYEKHDLTCHPETLRKAGVGIKMVADAGMLTFAEPAAPGETASYKEKQQFYDQRREYNKLLIEEARADHLTNELIKAANSLNVQKPLPKQGALEYTSFESEAVLFLSDWHYGLTTDNVWNTYDPAIADERIAKLCSEVKERLALHQIYKLHVVLLGDFISGAIHVSSRVKANEDTVEQLMHVSERIAELIAEISVYVNETHVYSTWGNHSRVTANIKDSVHSDNLERLIPFWLKQRFKGLDNIIIEDSSSHELIALFPCGVPVGATHGDLETNKGASLIVDRVFQKAFGVPMRYLVTGHFHHLWTDEQVGIEHIGVGSLCGTDDYAKDKRLFSKASQTLMIFDNSGLDAIYNIVLSD